MKTVMFRRGTGWNCCDGNKLYSICPAIWYRYVGGYIAKTFPAMILYFVTDSELVIVA